jgi:hypothetical protein
MNLVVSIDEDSFEKAFIVARKIEAHSLSRVQGLPAPVIDAVTRWVARAWDDIEQALRDAYEQGRGAAATAIQKVEAVLRQAATEIGDKVADVEAALRRRLDAWIDDIVNAALARIRATIKIGTRELTATSATIEQTLRLSGSIKTKLDELCSFIAEGQLAVSVEYASG